MSDVEDASSDVGEKNGDSRAYPLKVIYCPECSLPLEYCEFMPDAVLQRCKKWREDNVDLLEQEGVDMSSLAIEESTGDKKRQKRGGKSHLKAKPKKEPVDIKVARVPRAKRKYMTRVSGLGSFDINLKKASKLFAQKFSCGSTVSGDEIMIQGDVTDDVIDLILETWTEIDDSQVIDIGEVKK